MLGRFKKDSGYIQTTFTVIGNLASSAVSAISLIIITRILGPEKFGVFTVGFSIVLMLTKINELGLNTPLIKYASSSDSQKTRNAIYSLSAKYKLLFSLAVALFGLLGAEWLDGLINFHEPIIIKLAFTVGLATVYYEHLLSVLQSLHRFTQAVVINMIQAATKLVTALVMWLLDVKQVSLFFLAYIIAPLAPVLMSGRLLPSWLKQDLKTVDLGVQKRLISLAKHSSIALISAGIIENVDVLFLQKFLTTYETGLYGGVSRIAMVFAIVGYSLANVLNPRVAKYRTADHLLPYIKKSFGVVLLSILGFLAFIPLAKLSIFLTIGPEYYSGTGVLLILTAAGFLTIAAIPFMALFYSFDLSWYFSLSGLLQLAIIIVGNLIFVPVYGLEGAAWTKLASRLFFFLFTIILGLVVYQRDYVKKNQATTS